MKGKMGHWIRFIPRQFMVLKIEAILYPGIKITKRSVIILRFSTVVSCLLIAVLWNFTTIIFIIINTITDRLLFL